MDRPAPLDHSKPSKSAGASPEFRLIYIPGGGTAAIEAMRTKFDGNIAAF